MHLSNDCVEELSEPVTHGRHEPPEDIVGLDRVVICRPIWKVVLFLRVLGVDEDFVSIGRRVCKEHGTGVLMPAVVRSRKDCDACRVLILSLPHVQLVPIVFLLMGTDQGLEVCLLE